MAKSRRSSTSTAATPASPAESPPSEPIAISAESARHEAGFRFSLWHLAAAILIVLMLALMWPALRGDSATMDEQNHIARGLAYLRTGSLRLNRIHPPLINIIGAIPLALDHSITLPLKGQGWATSYLDMFAGELLWQTNDGPSIVRKARVPILGLAVLLALIVFAWASELYGRPAGILAMALAAFCPNLLAHGHLATNDVGAACFTTLALYTLWRFLRAPNWKRGAVCALALTLALGSKFSALFLVPVFAMLFVTDYVLGPGEHKELKWLKQIAIICAAGCGIIVLLIWALYGFKTGTPTEGGVTVPPSSYLEGLEEVRVRLSKGNPTFLLG